MSYREPLGSQSDTEKHLLATEPPAGDYGLARVKV